MDIEKNDCVQEQIDLTSAEIWKPIYLEIKLILEQREIMKASVCSYGVK